MPRQSTALSNLTCLSFLLLLFACGGDNDGVTGTPPPSDGGGPSSSSGDVARAGLLYDKWWVVNGGSTPTETHPGYPGGAQKSGADTWRCKECHGWDYLGVAGAYGSGSHFTGISGVLGAQGDPAETLFNQIKSGGNHDFSSVLSDTDVNDLVAFVQTGTINMNEVIDFNTKQALGNVANGQTLYSGSGRCQECHDADGLGNAADVPGAARGNPWETLHKIRWGHPSTSMPSAVDAGLALQDQVDILAYCQTLGT